MTKELAVYTTYFDNAWAYVRITGATNNLLSGTLISTPSRMPILSIIRALKSVDSNPERITVYSTCNSTARILSGGWIDSWESDGWKTINGRTVENADLWQELMEHVRINLAGTKVSFGFVSRHSDNVFVNDIERLAISTKNASEEKKMDNVISMFAPRAKSTNGPVDQTESSFDDIMAKNEEKKRKMAEDRAKANAGVKRSHRLQPGDTPRSPNHKKED